MLDDAPEVVPGQDQDGGGEDEPGQSVQDDEDIAELEWNLLFIPGDSVAHQHGGEQLDEGDI